MYYILELQTTGSIPAYLMQTAETKNEAMSKYHQVLAAAAISSVDIHACTVLDDHGISIAREFYIHSNPQSEIEE